MKSTKNLYNFYLEKPDHFVFRHTPEEVQKLRNFLVDMKDDVTELDERIQIHHEISQLSDAELFALIEI